MAPKWTIYISWRWKIPKAIWVLLVLEIPLSIAALALFGIADPDTYRTASSKETGTQITETFANLRTFWSSEIMAEWVK